MKKTAKWIEESHLFSGKTYVCSACRSAAKKPVPVCPKCKAKMVKTKYDPKWVEEAELLDAFFED